jgi:tetratricopeptide (TPR) repeat protein
VRVFLSFSGRDQGVVRRLILDLNRHGIEIWDYSRDEDQIPAAVPVRRGLSQELRRVDTVIVLISAASAAPESEYTKHEVEEALAHGMRIVPVHLCDSPAIVLSEPFAQLARLDLRYVTLSATSPGYERGASDLLSALGIRFKPQVLAHRRLPLFERFEEELSSAGVQVSNSVFTELGILAQAFAERYAVADWRAALVRVSRFCDRLIDKWPQVEFYYPWIAKGVCELHLEEFHSAERTFAGLVSNRRCDENAHVGKGHALFGQQRYRGALHDYGTAAAIARRHGRPDAEIEVNRVTTLLELGEPLPERILAPAMDAILEEDRPKVRLLRGIGLSRAGRLIEARTELRDVVQQFPALRQIAVSHLADVLLAMEDWRAAAAAIAECLRTGDGDSGLRLALHHRLAAIYTEAGLFERALPIYRDVLCVEGAWTRQYVTEYARLLRVLGRSAEATAACRSVIDATPFGIPATAHDHYYFGLALYLLGRTDAARVSFDLSGHRYPEYAEL